MCAKGHDRDRLWLVPTCAIGADGSPWSQPDHKTLFAEHIHSVSLPSLAVALAHTTRSLRRRLQRTWRAHIASVAAVFCVQLIRQPNVVSFTLFSCCHGSDWWRRQSVITLSSLCPLCQQSRSCTIQFYNSKLNLLRQECIRSSGACPTTLRSVKSTQQ